MITWWLTVALAEPVPDPAPDATPPTEQQTELPTEQPAEGAPTPEPDAPSGDAPLPDPPVDAPPTAPAPTVATEGATVGDAPVPEPAPAPAPTDAPVADESAVPGTHAEDPHDDPAQHPEPAAPDAAAPHPAPDPHADSGQVEYGPPALDQRPATDAALDSSAPVTELADDASDLVSYLPVLPSNNQWTAPLLLLGALLAWAIGQLGRLAQSRLGPTGVLPSTARVLQALGRSGAVLLVLGAFVALRPEGPVATLVVLGGALAVGWSLRDALPDLVAWVFLIAEGRIRTGVWVRGDAYEGRIDAIGPRATFVVGTRGEQTSVPNRRLLRDAVQTSPEPFTSTDVRVVLPGVAAPRARSAIQEAVLLSPWLAPGTTVEIGQDPGSPNTWLVRARLLDGVFREAFEGTLPARIHAVLTTPASSIGS